MNSVNLRIGATATDGGKSDTAPATLFHFDDSTPTRSHPLYARNVLRCAHDRQLSQAATVKLKLCRESVERVLAALNFISMHTAVYHRHVDANPSMRQTQLVHDDRVR